MDGAWRPAVAGSRGERPPGVPRRPRAPAGRLPSPRTTWALEPAGSTRTPAASRTSRNRTEPSPAASGFRPASATRAATSSGVRGERRPYAAARPRTAPRTPRPGPRRSAAALSGASMPRARAASEDTGRSSSPRAVSKRPRGGDADPQTRERPGSHPHRDRVELVPGQARARRDSPPPPASARRRGPAGEVSASAGGSCSKASPSARSTQAALAGVEVSMPEQVHSIVIMRRSPPACSSRTRATTPSSSGSATSGHSTNADPVGRQVVVEQRRVLARQGPQPVEVEVGDLDRFRAARGRS